MGVWLTLGLFISVQLLCLIYFLLKQLRLGWDAEYDSHKHSTTKQAQVPVQGIAMIIYKKKPMKGRFKKRIFHKKIITMCISSITYFINFVNVAYYFWLDHTDWAEICLQGSWDLIPWIWWGDQSAKWPKKMCFLEVNLSCLFF